EHSVRRISVVQPTHHHHHHSHTTTHSPPIFTTKSSPQLTGPATAALPIISSSHISSVIQPVLHSGATVIENNYRFPSHQSIPICYDNASGGRSHTQMTTTTQPVLNTYGTDLVNAGARTPIEMLPAYMPHLQRPQATITFKGPIVFPVLKDQLANGTNIEFTVDDEYYNSSDSSFPSPERKTSATTTDKYRQVASQPALDTNDSDASNETEDAIDEEMEVLDKDKENDKEVIRVLSPVNGLVVPKTTGAIRPTTLSLRSNNGSNLVSSILVSPDTPRSNKTCVETYMSGHAYSRIGHKVKPRPVYCTIYKTQPMFVQQETDPHLSMYSNWTTSPLTTDDVMNLATPPVVLGLYDSRDKHRVDSMVMTSPSKTELNSTHSSYWRFRRSDDEKENLKDVIARLREDVGESAEQVYRKLSEEVSASSAYSGDTDSDGGANGDAGPPKRVRIFEGGFKSNEDYTYVRGRGRGKYVCEECGIRCKKPSMLKKHIRTHTDLRPYSCRHCAFAFKTKGNLTKHMKSKAHHKKCVEMGIIPVPITIDESQIDTDALAKQEMLEISCGNLPEDEDEDEDEGEWDEDEEEEDDEGVPIPLIELQRMAPLPVVPGQFDDADMEGRTRTVSESGSNATEAEEQEAARSLLILSGSGSESDLTTTTARKTSNAIHEDIPNSPEKRKVSVIDRRVSQQMFEEKQRRVSQQILEAEQQRRISQHQMSPIAVKPVSEPVADFHMSSIMKPPTEPMMMSSPRKLSTEPPMMSSPRKLSPIEQLQQQVHQHQQHLLQTTWTPNCDQLSRPRSYSFNDVPLVPSNHSHNNVFNTTTSSHIPLEPIEPISEESSGEGEDSMDSFALRRYSMSVIAERRFDSQPRKTSSQFPAIQEREEPMDLSLSTKPNEPVIEGIVLPQMTSPNAVPNGLAAGLRHGEFIPKAPQRVIVDSVDGKSICSICSKQFSKPSQLRLHENIHYFERPFKCDSCAFSKPSQLRLHENIHYFERPFKCDSCAVSFRTKGHLQKHKRSVSHFNKVTINSTFGTPTTDNPRPFKCADCKIAFRIHGHLAKHLRSKMHIMKLECLGKLPFGMYAEMERSGVNLNEIDTTDCENSLQSLQMMAQRLYDPRQMRWASEPMPESDNHSFDDNSQVKNEPNEGFYHSLDQRERQPPVLVNSQPSLPPPPPLLTTSPRIPSQLSPITRPSSPPAVPKSPPVPQQQPQPPVPPPAAAVAPQPQSGFTSTRSNTCHLCGQTFKGAKFLQVHLYCDHPSESPSPQVEERHDYECDYCHKGFDDVVIYHEHQLTHTAARPHVCDTCDAGFTSSLLLGSHMQTHHPLAQQMA
ncbi:unnamed protein product, partial [Oppiella nova]